MEQNNQVKQGKSKVVCGLLGIFLGHLGIHRFYMGYTSIGFMQLALNLAWFFTCGITSIIAGIWGLIEGIMIFTGSINEPDGTPLQ